jgi:hypothetical protein
MELYMFRTVRLSIIRSLFNVHLAMVYVIQALYTLLSSRSICSCSKAVCTVPVWHIPLLSVHWTNSWWWTDELSETCRVPWQNKWVKLVHLVGFITKKRVPVIFYFIYTAEKRSGTGFSKMQSMRNECLSLKTFQCIVHYVLHLSVYNVLCYRTSFLNVSLDISSTVH